MCHESKAFIALDAHNALLIRIKTLSAPEKRVWTPALCCAITRGSLQLSSLLLAPFRLRVSGLQVGLQGLRFRVDADDPGSSTFASPLQLN